MPRLIAQFCLSPGTVTGTALAGMIAHHDLGFTAERLSCHAFDASNGVDVDHAGLARLATVRSLRWARVDGPAGEYFGLATMPRHNNHQLVWETDSVRGGLPREIVRSPGFVAGYIGDAQDVYWQSETSVDADEAARIPHDDLPKRAGGFFPWETEEIDISGNPGRRVALDGIWLWAAATMWFGGGAFRYLDREQLLELPVGEVSEESTGIVRVDLFPIEWHRRDVPQVRARQRRFREWMALDELERRADEVVHDGE